MPFCSPQLMEAFLQHLQQALECCQRAWRDLWPNHRPLAELISPFLLCFISPHLPKQCMCKTITSRDLYVTKRGKQSFSTYPHQVTALGCFPCPVPPPPQCVHLQPWFALPGSATTTSMVSLPLSTGDLLFASSAQPATLATSLGFTLD